MARCAQLAESVGQLGEWYWKKLEAGNVGAFVLTSRTHSMLRGITVTRLVSRALTATEMAPLVRPLAVAVTTLVSLAQRVMAGIMQLADPPTARVVGKLQGTRLRSGSGLLSTVSNRPVNVTLPA